MLFRLSGLCLASCVIVSLVGCSIPYRQDEEVRTISFSMPVSASSHPGMRTQVDSGWRDVQVSGPAEEQTPESHALLDARRLVDLADQKSEEGFYEEALGYLIEAASLGSAEAHYELAKIYTRGEIVEGNSATASRHLQAAASLGYAEAYRVLGWQLIRGDSGATDIDGGLALMTMAAESSVRAQRELGMMYAGRYPFSISDVVLAKKYLSQAAQAGDVEGAYELGLLLRAEGDALGAIAALGQAADSGHTKAKDMLNALDPAPAAPH